MSVSIDNAEAETTPRGERTKLERVGECQRLGEPRVRLVTLTDRRGNLSVQSYAPRFAHRFTLPA